MATQGHLECIAHLLHATLTPPRRATVVRRIPGRWPNPAVGGRRGSHVSAETSLPAGEALTVRRICRAVRRDGGRSCITGYSETFTCLLRQEQEA